MAKQNQAVQQQQDALENAFGVYDGSDSNKAKPSIKGVYPEPGSYIVEVLKVKMEKSWKGHNIFIANLFIHKSNNPRRPAGTRMDYTMPITQPFPETKLGNIRGFLAAGYDVDWNEIDSKKSADACRHHQPLRGKRLQLEVVLDKKKDGSPLNVCQFEPLRGVFQIEATQSDIAAAAAEAEHVGAEAVDADQDLGF